MKHTTLSFASVCICHVYKPNHAFNYRIYWFVSNLCTYRMYIFRSSTGAFHRRPCTSVTDHLHMVPFMPSKSSGQQGMMNRKITRPGTDQRSLSTNGYVTFYDWSNSTTSWHDAGEQLSRQSSAKHLPSDPTENSSRSRLKHWYAGEQGRNYSGRMFLREKTSLTKGEQEIISGICKNRGDLPSGEHYNKRGQKVFTHREAWIVGKPLRKSLPVDKEDSELVIDLKANNPYQQCAECRLKAHTHSSYSEQTSANGTPRVSLDASGEQWHDVPRVYTTKKFPPYNNRGKWKQDIIGTQQHNPTSLTVGTNYKVIPNIHDPKKVEVFLPQLSGAEDEDIHDQSFEDEDQDLAPHMGNGQFVESEDEELRLATPSSDDVDINIAPPSSPTSQ